MVQLSSKVKAGEESKVGGFQIHAKGSYVFQIQEGIDFKVGEKDTGKSYTYFIPAVSIDVHGDKGDSESVGRPVDQWINVVYSNDEVNDGGLALFSAILVHTGLFEAEADVDICSQQFADALKLPNGLVDKLIGFNVDWKKETQTKTKDDDGNLVDIPKEDQKTFDRPYVVSVFPVGGGAGGVSGEGAAEPDLSY